MRALVAAELARKRHAAVKERDAELATANTTVIELRTQLAALSSELRGQLSAKGAEADQLQTRNTSLSAQLEELQAARQQVESHAGAARRLWLACPVSCEPVLSLHALTHAAPPFPPFLQASCSATWSA